MGGITTGDENPQSNSCSTLKCCPEKQAQFEQCVIQSAQRDIGNEPHWYKWVPAINDCCVWANRIVGSCWNKYCANCCK